MVGHGIRRRADGAIRVRLGPRERAALRDLPDQLRPVLTGEAAPEGVRERLFPVAYDDPEAEQEYRGLVDGSLTEERLAALDVFEETLDGGEEGRLGWVADLDDEAAVAWLSAINDTRLTLGVLLGIESELTWEERHDDNPASALMSYLGWLQEELVAAMSAGLER